MATVYLKPGETTEKLLQRFKWAMTRDDILSVLKEREFYRKPSLIKQDEARKLKQKIKEAKRLQRKYLP